jgi:hypothetical protein
MTSFLQKLALSSASMKTLIICSILLSLSNANANLVIKVWTATTTTGEAEITLYDLPKMKGEEVITWVRGEEVKTVKVPSKQSNGDNFSGNYMVEDDSGKVIEDYDYSLFMDKALDGIKKQLKVKAFQDTLDNKPGTCEEATGFLLLQDNLNSKLFGLCLFTKK